MRARAMTQQVVFCNMTLKLPHGAELPAFVSSRAVSALLPRRALSDMSGSGSIPVSTKRNRDTAAAFSTDQHLPH
jgi:hypothetical protein